MPDARSPLLKRGAHGAAVEALQHILVGEGFLRMTTWSPQGERAIPFGFFGRLTESALAHFQQTHVDPLRGAALEVSGVTDLPTWRALRSPAGRMQRSDLVGTIPAGLTPERIAVLQACVDFHALDVHEVPNGSNRGPYIDDLMPAWAQGQPWCAWCAWTKTLETVRRPVLGRTKPIGSTYRTYVLAKAHGAWRSEGSGYEPIPGDIALMLYRDEDGRFTYRGHTFIVGGTAPGELSSWEGNAGNRFKLGRRKRATVEGYVNHYGASEQPKKWQRGLIGDAAATDHDSTR